MGDQVFLKVASCKNIIKFRMKCKLAPRYVGFFEIIKKIEPIAYKL